MASGFVDGPRQVLGRDLAQLTGCGSVANGVVLLGEPGAGRTTLLRQLEELVGIPVVWILGQDHAATQPYASLVTMLRSGGWASDWSAALLEAAEQAAGARVPPDPPLVLEHIPQLKRAAARTLVIVDDLQLFDGHSQAVVTALARRASWHNRSVILATCEPTDQAHVRGLPSVEVPPLSIAETRTIVEQRQGQGIPYRVAELLQRRTGGNPTALLDVLPGLSAAQIAGLDLIGHPLELSALAAGLLGRNLSGLKPEAVQLLAACAVQPTLTLAEATAVLGPVADQLSGLVHSGWVRTVGLGIKAARPAECLAAWSMLTPQERQHIHTRLGSVATPGSDLGLFHRAAAGKRLGASAIGDAAVRLFRSGCPDLAMACSELAERRPGSAALGLATHYLMDGYIASVRRVVAAHHRDPEHSTLTADDATSLEAEVALLTHIDKEQLGTDRTRATGAEPRRSWFRAAFFLARSQLASGGLDEAAQTLDLVAESLPAADPDLVALHAVVAAELLHAKGDVNATYLLPTAIQAWSSLYHGPFGLELAVAAYRLMLLGQLRSARALLMRHAPTAPFTPALSRSAFLTARMGVELSAGHFAAASETLVEYDQAMPSIGGGVHRLAQAIRINAACGPSPERLAIEARLDGDLLDTLPTRFRSTLSAAVGARHLIEGDYLRAGFELERALRHVVTLAHPPAEILTDLLEAKLASGVSVADRHAVFVGVRRTLPDHAGERFPSLMARGAALTVGPAALDAAFAEALQSVPAEFEVDRARTLLAYGRALIRASRKAEAAGPIAAALVIFESEGLSGWADHVHRLVASERLPAPDAEPLTDVERHIVSLLVQRKTNREIAAELYMSKRSLESQLTRIFRKLGVRRKSDILRDA